jgi:predicted ester cyclase
MAVLVAAAWGCAGCAKSTPVPEAPHAPAPEVTQALTPVEPPAPSVAKVPEAPQVPPAPPLSGEATVAMYEQCWGYFNDRKWDEFKNCYAEDAVGMEAGNPRAYKGKTELIDKSAKAFTEAFPDGKGELQLILVNGKQIAAIALFRGTHTGPLLTPLGELAPTGKKVGYLLAHHIVLNDQNKVQKQWMVFDVPTLMAQLGKSKAKARKAIVKGADEPLVEIAKDDAVEKSNTQAHAKLYELFNAHDPAMFELMTNDVVESDASMPKDITGKAQCKKSVESMWKGFSDLRIDSQGIWASGTHTLSLGQFKGTNDGDVPELGLKKTGKTMDTFYLEFVEWKDGKAKKIMPFGNSAEMAMQLGLLPEPGAEPGKKPEKPEASAAPPEKQLAPDGQAPKPSAENGVAPSKKATPN